MKNDFSTTTTTLQQSEIHYRALLEGLPDVIIRFDYEGVCLYASENILEMTGIKAEDFLHNNLHELGFPDTLSTLCKEFLQKSYHSGSPSETEFSLTNTKGHRIYNWRFIPEKDSYDNVLSVLTICRDITDHRRIEQDYTTLFNKMLSGFALHEIICNESGVPIDYRFLSVNPAFEKMTGMKAADVIGKKVSDILPGIEPYWIETYGRVALTGQPATITNKAADLGKYFEVTAFRNAPNQFACIFADITDRIVLEGKLLQAQKMEAIGTLAGGIAHDFNNILGVILGYAEMIDDEAPENSSLANDIKQILIASNRARDLVKQILAFSNRTTSSPVPTQPDIILQETLTLLRGTLPSTIQITERIDKDAGLVLVDPTKLHQILLNLCTNAYHAMEKHGGILSIALEKQTFRKSDLRGHPKVQPGEFIKISIIDNGTGIAPENMDRIFEPYFTTKDTGKGSGMGLAVTHGTVHGYGGFITVDSQLNKGTAFHVMLPVFKN